MRRSSSSSTLKTVVVFLVFAGVVGLAAFNLLQTMGSKNSPTVAGSATVTEGELDETQVRKVVEQYIRENPELIMTVLTEYQMESLRKKEVEAQQNISQNKDALEKDPSSPVAGNPNGDVTLVEFFDYSCGYCKKVFPSVAQLLKEDKNLRLVFKEYPILGQSSMMSSQVALAVYHIAPDKYMDVHKSLMGAHITSLDQAIALVGSLGIDKEAFKTALNDPKIQEVINKNRELASSIGVRGTPAFVINGEFVPGAIDLDSFKQKIKAARDSLANAAAPANAAPENTDTIEVPAPDAAAQ